jgi:predicted  nucleic acid-binding Zn-ribbon protein
MLQEVTLSVELQALDRKIANLEKEIAALPVHVAEIEKKLGSHKLRLDIDRSALAANQRDRKKFEGEIQVHEQKISKLKGQTLDAKTNEQYKAFQNEINWCETEIRKAEDKIIELMEQAEPLDKAVKTAEAALKVEQVQVETEKRRAHDRSAEDQTFLAEANAMRKALVAKLDPRFYTRYEQIKKKTKGTVVADATEGRCEGCQISLRPQLFQDLKVGDKVIFCELCGRILVYNPAVLVEH